MSRSPETEEMTRLRLGLWIYGALWTAFFVAMGLSEAFDLVGYDSTLGSLVRWGHGGRAYLLMLVAINVVIGLALLRSSTDPPRHRSAIDLALTINAVHLATMALLAVTEPHEHAHLVGDVPAGLIPTVVLWALWLPVRAQTPR